MADSSAAELAQGLRAHDRASRLLGMEILSISDV
jgi:hypothetical protein